MKDKRNIIEEYQVFCFNNCCIENSSSASLFAELYLNKETKINARRISTLYAYIENKEI